MYYTRTCVPLEKSNCDTSVLRLLSARYCEDRYRGGTIGGGGGGRERERERERERGGGGGGRVRVIKIGCSIDYFLHRCAYMEESQLDWTLWSLGSELCL